MVNVAIDLDESFINADITFDFSTGVEIIFDMRTSFPRVEYQRLAIGFENSQRKMMKAHIDVLGEVNGVELDYLFTNIKDCVALIKLDFPFQDWTDMCIDVGSQIKTEMMNLRVGAGINNLKLGGSFLKLKKRIITDLTFNNNL